MRVNQIYELMNGVVEEVLGQEAVVQEDWSMLYIGKTIIPDNLDNYVQLVSIARLFSTINL